MKGRLVFKDILKTDSSSSIWLWQECEIVGKDLQFGKDGSTELRGILWWLVDYVEDR